jgi:hypothetical protein
MSTNIPIKRPEPRMTCHSGEFIHKKQKSPEDSGDFYMLLDTLTLTLEKLSRSRPKVSVSGKRHRAKQIAHATGTTESRFRHHPCNLSTKHKDSPFTT